jgi:hypothetical protein
MPFRYDNYNGALTDVRTVKRYEAAANVIIAGLVAVIAIALAYAAHGGS